MDDCLRQARAVSISCDERMLALLLQQNDTPTDSRGRDTPLKVKFCVIRVYSTREQNEQRTRQQLVGRACCSMLIMLTDGRASPHLIWGVEDKRGSLYVLDAVARTFTLGRSSKCDVCLDPALG